VLVGGTAALSEAVEHDLLEAGIESIERVAGGNRFEVGAAVAARLDASHAFLVEGIHADPNRGWPDAIAASGLAAHERHPILLVGRDDLPAATLKALRWGRISSVTIVGGPAAVSDGVAAQLEAEGLSVTRRGGDTRYDTSVEVARHAEARGLSPARTLVVTGGAWPDALAAGPAAAARDANVVLVHGEDLAASPATAGWIEERAGQFESVYLVGGSAAISPLVAVGVELAGTS
jgi:N-acetylmuramoyl-L-alanine amidase